MPQFSTASRPADKAVINRLSVDRCVPPSVYIGFRLFVLLGRRSGDVSSMLRKVRGTLVSWANCSVGVQSCPFRPAASPRAPTRPARSVSRFWNRQVSNYHGVRKREFSAKSGPKGAFCSRRAQQGNSARDCYRHMTRPSFCIIFLRRTAAGGLEDDPSLAGSLRTFSVISRSTCKGFPDRRVRISWTLNQVQRRT